jgi:hypothetical protein
MNYRLIFCLLLILLMVGIVSADTLIVYPSGTEDGRTYRATTQNTFSNLRSGVGTGVQTGDNDAVLGINSGTTTDYYTTLSRHIFEFNTSNLPDDCTINSAKMSIAGHSGGYHTMDGDLTFGVTGFTPGTPGTIAASDFQTFGNTLYSDTYIQNTSWSLVAYNNFTFNDAGVANISKTGYTNTMLRLKWDIINDPTGLTWKASSYLSEEVQFSEHAGSLDPLITITYTTGGGGSAPVASFTCTKNFLRIPNSVTCTDSSTNTPTSWSWDMGDGSAAKTTQNVTYPYMKRGIWGITLNATNAQGSNVTPSASNVRVVGYENNW